MSILDRTDGGAKKEKSQAKESLRAFADLEPGLLELASRFFSDSARRPGQMLQLETKPTAFAEDRVPTTEERYRVLVEQIPAVVFMVFLDGGLSEAYVSPHIEELLGFSREEWLDDPIRWYSRIHPDDKERWSIEAADLLLTGSPLRSVYRVLAKDGRTVWFRCEAKIVRRSNGELWFVHGVGFDITELKETELALQRETAERERLQKP
jgi:PAS domain S-box-containing protein